MTAADILWEFRQIRAWEYELKTGKKAEDDIVTDPDYEAWQESLGIHKDR